MTDSLEEELRIMEERADEDPLEYLQQPLDQLCTRPAVSIDVSATLEEAIGLMRDRAFGAILVTEDGKLTGIFTERDLLTRVSGKITDLATHAVSEAMSRNPESLRLGDKIIFVMNMMHIGGFRHVPIVDDEHRPLHVLSIKDMLAYVLEPMHDEIVSIPPEPFRGESKVHSG